MYSIMPPYTKEKTMRRINEEEVSNKHIKYEYSWRNIVTLAFFHISGIYGFFLLVTKAKLATQIFVAFLYMFTIFGITAGVHRLWSHRSYSANTPFRIFIMLLNSAAFQGTIISWARDHRVHHKFTETNADPYDASRGFFFCHMGWLMVRKHPEVMRKGNTIDLSDLYADPVVRFQKKYYLPLALLMCFTLPTVIPWYFWAESLKNSFFVCVCFRFCFVMHVTWLVNSAAHMWGFRPYDKNIYPAENKLVSFFALGEGWHNYHHTFPWDYKTAELGNYAYNMTTLFIDTCYKLGLVYDLKTVPDTIVKQRVLRTGDGTHASWGWGDPDQTKEEKQFCYIK